MSVADRPAARRAALERLPLLLLGFVALIVGAGTGLARLAWPMPSAMARVYWWKPEERGCSSIVAGERHFVWCKQATHPHRLTKCS